MVFVERSAALETDSDVALDASARPSLLHGILHESGFFQKQESPPTEFPQLEGHLMLVGHGGRVSNRLRALGPVNRLDCSIIDSGGVVRL